MTAESGDGAETDRSEMRRQTVEANDLSFEYLRVGDGDRLALCLHGFPDDAGSMEPILRRLADAGFTAIAPFMRGYAPTDPAPDGDYSVEALGADAVALEAALSRRFETDGSVLVGHDWGATAAYAADRIDASAFDRMVTLAVPPGFQALIFGHPKQAIRSWYMWFFQLPNVPERVLRRRDFALVELLWGLWSPEWEYPENRIRAVKETFATGGTVENALQYYRDAVGPTVASLLGGDVPSVATTPPISTPTLVICGGQDGCIGAELFERADEIVEDCRAVRVREAGHFMHQERPSVVGDEIVSWVTKND